MKPKCSPILRICPASRHYIWLGSATSCELYRTQFIKHSVHKWRAHHLPSIYMNLVNFISSHCVRVN